MESVIKMKKEATLLKVESVCEKGKFQTWSKRFSELWIMTVVNQ